VASIVIYEVECQLDPDIIEDYDAWLPGHVRDVLACAGFLGATIESPETAPGERQRRLIRYRVENVAALDHYLENNATRLRTETAQRFGGRVQCERRSIKPRHDLLSAELEPQSCLDCGAPVTGRHCDQCGQAGDVHVLSMREVAGDITHSLLHLDSRVWRTLRLLILKPGELTREFIVGRHQRYLPPFRLYLAISILFFALTAILPDTTPFQTASKDEILGEVRKELETAGVDTKAIDEARREGKPCEADIPSILGLDLEKPIKRACERIQADGGAALADRFAATAPKLMFLFLPLMAAIALLFYWRPRRLYAEHLVLFLHNHAFTFLLIGVMEVLSALAAIDLPLMGVFGFVNFLLLLYLPWYLFRSMRVVYGDGRLLTFVKFFLLAMIYFVLLGVTMLGGLLYSVLSL
jgi:hypothetical protein